MKRSFRTLMVIVMAMVAAGCGKSEDKKIASQVAAKVNGDEITVHQINSVLARGGAVSTEQAKQAAPQILERIIDQQLLVEKAVAAKLDRDPAVVQNLEIAKRQILSQAYIEKTMIAAAKSTKDEIHRFYDENAALFKERRVFRIQEITVAVPADKLSALRDTASKARSMGDVAAWLKSQNIQYNVASSTKSAEQLPMELLPQLAKMKDGQIGLVSGPGGAAVMQIVQSQQVPLTEEQATPIIERFLMNKRRGELAAVEVKKLRDAAKIVYVGEFEKSKVDTSIPAKAAPEQAAMPAPAAPAPGTPVQTAVPRTTPEHGVAPAIPLATKKGDSVIDKGLSGLQ